MIWRKGEADVLIGRRLKLSMFVFAVSFALNGCTSLATVSSISSDLTSASATWDRVADDVYASCERRVYLSSNSGDNCVREKDASDGLKTANAVLREYFAALGEAASGDNFTISPGLGNVGASVAKIPGVDADKVEAVSKLAQFLSQLFLDAKRERTIRKLIDEAGPNAVVVVDLLRTDMVNRVEDSLKTEEEGLDTTFQTWLQNEKFTDFANARTFCLQPRSGYFSRVGDGINLLLVEAYCQRVKDIVAKRKAIQDYAKSLDTSKQALGELQSSRTRLKSSELAKKLYTIANDLNDQIEAVDKAFS